MVPNTLEASQLIVAAACADTHRCALCCCRKGAVIEEDVVLKTPEDGRVAQLTTDSLVVRLNTLLYVEEQLPAMEKVVMDRCGSPAGTSGSSAPGAVLAVVCSVSSCQGTKDAVSGACCVLHQGLALSIWQQGCMGHLSYADAMGSLCGKLESCCAFLTCGIAAGALQLGG